jgi:hypothetical protein
MIDMINSSADRVPCPACGQSDQVAKVSAIYLDGIKDKNLYSLSRKLAPPSSGKAAPTRPVHPDVVVIVFSCIVPFFLYGILGQQSGFFIPAIFLLAGFYGFYFWKRKAIIARFKQQEATRQMEQDRTKRGIETWMKLYYCARDEGVFLEGKGELIPLERMREYLLRD